jgi:hypothetical protein
LTRYAQRQTYFKDFARSTHFNKNKNLITLMDQILICGFLQLQYSLQSPAVCSGLHGLGAVLHEEPREAGLQIQGIQKLLTPRQQ